MEVDLPRLTVALRAADGRPCDWHGHWADRDDSSVTDSAGGPLRLQAVDEEDALALAEAAGLSVDAVLDDGAEFGLSLPWNDVDFAPSSAASGLSAVLAALDSAAAAREAAAAAEAAAEEEDIDAEWLFSRCEQLLAMQASPLLTAVQLAKSIASELRSSKSAHALQDVLFGLLGGDGFELLQALLEHRDELRSVSNRELTVIARAAALDGGGGGGGGGGGSGGPTLGATVTVTTDLDRDVAKLRRKQARRAARRKKAAREAGGGAGDGGKKATGWLEEIGFDADALRRAADARLAKLQEKPAGLPERSAETGELIMPKRAKRSGWAPRSSLPEGTRRTKLELADQVVVPAPRKPVLKESDLVPVSVLDEVTAVAFDGLTHFNRMQSEVFGAAFHSGVNLLVCAPTGAGKTNVALLTVMREVLQNVSGGVLDTKKFKVIYIAPMKALAAEVVDKFGRRLEPLGITVKELTGDMQLSRREIAETQMIVTTPEKWDVITRKSSERELAASVKLLIIDEVHLLADDRGAVIEALVARTLRQVESSQSMIRIVGLSATLPNYRDVALFLRVPASGLFHFDGSYRPVPLEQIFLAVNKKRRDEREAAFDQLCYERTVHSLRRGKQVMIFVHSRRGTSNTIRALLDIAGEMSTLADFDCSDTAAYRQFSGKVKNSRNADLQLFFRNGCAIHHAGMLRSDRTLVERMYAAGAVRVLCCTSTLAWGVNLPAYTVIIRGTEVYIPSRGGRCEISLLDVQQIFGRAGRPQFDTSGEAIILTTHDKLNRYLTMLTHQVPIESQFLSRLEDALNAEVVSGTVTNLKEAVSWLSYTYLYIRMLRNPLAYGITHDEKDSDPLLELKRRELLVAAARKLDDTRMIRFMGEQGNMAVTNLGRVASHYYVSHESVDTFNGLLREIMTDADVLHVMCLSREFQSMSVRSEELAELEELESRCPIEVIGEGDDKHRKASILLQAYISNMRVRTFTLVCDMSYVQQNAGRVARALFEICLKKGWATAAVRLLELSKCVEHRIWWFHSPLRQLGRLSAELLGKVEASKLSIDRMLEMSGREIGALVRHHRAGDTIAKLARQVPRLAVECGVQPITRGILRLSLTVTADFTWKDRLHGAVQSFWILVLDGESEVIYHAEQFRLMKRVKDEPQELSFMIPIFPPLPPQYYVQVVSDHWVGVSTTVPVSFKHLMLPEEYPPHTALLRLQPLPVATLRNASFQSLYPFTHFNSIQTQVFHTVYHSDANVLLGAPTGSGKTAIAELSILRMLATKPGGKAVYIAPLKALVRERLKDWKRRLGGKLGKAVVELTGDVTPDLRALKAADVIITTPEKWDGISRSWRRRSYVKDVEVIVIDEIHLLGEERGPILEVIVSRARYISHQLGKAVRIVGLSTAVSNPKDLADWLGIGRIGVYNFKPSMRPVPLETHIQGFPGKHYCPRMATMNRPAYASILLHSPAHPALVFVASRRQTRLTALEFISFCAGDDNPKRFLHMPEEDMELLTRNVRERSLRHTLAFGIGIHHAGLAASDRDLVEELFCNGKIQVLVCTATLAWGVNFPARLVVIKGTEFFDAKQGRYVDFRVTDVLQMMGRAGRPQYDDKGKAVILCHEPKKSFYRNFLRKPFPVESQLKGVLHNHLNAEVAGGTIASKQDAVDYLSWTFMFRRLLQNPSYYGLEDASVEGVKAWLLALIDSHMADLARAGCVELGDGGSLEATTLGFIASFYYLDYRSAGMFANNLTEGMRRQDLLRLCCDATEFDELPVRHNEDRLNGELAALVRWPVDDYELDSPNTKAFLLLQAHFAGVPLPITDYVNDTKSVLDQVLRVLNAMVDVAADSGLLQTALQLMALSQMAIQGRWYEESTLFQLPHMTQALVDELDDEGATYLPQLMAMPRRRLRSILHAHVSSRHAEVITRRIDALPNVKLSWSLPGGDELAAEAEAEMEVTLRMSNSSRTGKVYAPKFRKPKEYGWWLLLGDEEGELMALKRVSFGKLLKTKLAFLVPDALGRVKLRLMLVSDCISGLDQEYAVDILCVEGSDDEEEWDDEEEEDDE